MPDLPGSARVVARRFARCTLRLTVRSDGLINARLGALAPADFGFAVPSAPAIMHGSC